MLLKICLVFIAVWCVLYMQFAFFLQKPHAQVLLSKRKAAIRKPAIQIIRKPEAVLIIPMRDREEQWVTFKEHMCQQPPMEMDIWALRQKSDALSFNRGWLFNVGLKLVNATYSDTACVALHDIDLLPMPGVNYTNCTRATQLSSELEDHGWSVPYDSSCGGVFLAKLGVWKQINGVANEFWGWGGEDDELFQRLRHAGLLDVHHKPFRPPRGMGRFKKNLVGHFRKPQVEHEYQNNVRLLGQAQAAVKADGLQQTQHANISQSATAVICSNNNTGLRFFEVNVSHK